MSRDTSMLLGGKCWRLAAIIFLPHCSFLYTRLPTSCQCSLLQVPEGLFHIHRQHLDTTFKIEIRVKSLSFFSLCYLLWHDSYFKGWKGPDNYNWPWRIAVKLQSLSSFILLTRFLELCYYNLSHDRHLKMNDTGRERGKNV